MMLVPYTVAILAVLIGVGTIGAFTVFIYIGSFHFIVLPLENSEILALDAGLAALFFIQHSVMVRPWFKEQLLKVVPAAYYGAVFSISSGMALLALVILWQGSASTIVSIDGVWRLVLRGAFFLVLFLQTWALWTLKAVDLFGNQALVARRDVALNTEGGTILMVGAYGWVRHPIYSTSILLLWCYPDLTVDRLLLNSMFTIWIVVGAVLEERDLVGIYGDQYRNYQRMVPMLVPYRKQR